MSLSDEEILQVVGNRADIGDAVRIARAIEAKIETKLREQEPFGYYWNFKDMEEGIITGQHFVEGEAEEQGYIPLWKHPAPIPESIQDFIYKFKRHVGGDGEFWLHELEDFYVNMVARSE